MTEAATKCYPIEPRNSEADEDCYRNMLRLYPILDQQ